MLTNCIQITQNCRSAPSLRKQTLHFLLWFMEFCCCANTANKPCYRRMFHFFYQVHACPLLIIHWNIFSWIFREERECIYPDKHRWLIWGLVWVFFPSQYFWHSRKQSFYDWKSTKGSSSLECASKQLLCLINSLNRHALRSYTSSPALSVAQ